MKRMYLVISATVVVAIMGYAAWKFSSSSDNSSSDSGQPARTAHQDNPNDAPTLSDGTVIVLPPTAAPQTEATPSDTHAADFKLPPDSNNAPSGADVQSPASAPAIKLPPSMP
jgi:hypothetical protein